MPRFLLLHKHPPHECAFAIAAWRGFKSPLRGGRPLGSCVSGGHQIWWTVEAPDDASALAQLPSYVAERTAVERVAEVPIP
jgi:hypothetical protein